MTEEEKRIAHNKRSAKYGKKNREKIKEGNKLQYLKNRDEYIILSKERNRQRRNNPEKRLADLVKNAEWRDKNREKLSITAISGFHKRRARLAGTPSPGVSPKQWKEILITFDYRCAYCLRKAKQLQREHIVSIASGGGDEYYNVVPACAACNYCKGSKSLLTFITRQGGSFGLTPTRLVSIVGSTV